MSSKKPMTVEKAVELWRNLSRHSQEQVFIQLIRGPAVRETLGTIFSSQNWIRNRKAEKKRNAAAQV